MMYSFTYSISGNPEFVQKSRDCESRRASGLGGSRKESPSRAGRQGTTAVFNCQAAIGWSPPLSRVKSEADWLLSLLLLVRLDAVTRPPLAHTVV